MGIRWCSECIRLCGLLRSSSGQSNHYSPEGREKACVALQLLISRCKATLLLQDSSLQDGISS